MQEQAIDWPGIRANAVLIGVREAARQAARDLPPREKERFVDRVLQRCRRQGWLREKNAIIAANAAKISAPTSQALPLSANVGTGSQAAATRLADDSNETKIYLSTAAKKGA